MSDTKSSKQQRDRALKQAALVIRKLKQRVSELETEATTRHEPVAIVGIGCRFPGGADGPEAFWKLLDEGRDAVSSLAERWAFLGVSLADDVPGWAGLLTASLDQFDPEFFGISPREAAKMDPQQRLLLEVAWEALEDAGVLPATLSGSRTGVFLGASVADYTDTMAREPADDRDAYSTTGSMLSIAAGRLAYTLGLQGPCLTVDTACSSSLVATHLACRSLLSRESDLAVAGGVNLLLSPQTMTGLARTQALSPDGRCRAFDARANGFVRGEGCGLVVLKRLSDARSDGDRIWALIRGSAVNQDGRSTGLTAPNVLAQTSLVREALGNAGVEPHAIGFVETHGTGTSLGDPIEVEALRAVLGAESGRAPCVLGALKTNLGHLEAAAGVAGLIKTALVLAHERIPKNLNFQTLSPRVRLEGTSLVVAAQARAWPRGDSPRLAGVSSFGLSGTNAHAILEEAPPVASTALPGDNVPPATRHVYVLSGRSEEACSAQAARLHAHLQASPECPLEHVAHSLATTRTAMAHRLAIAADDRTELLDALDAAAHQQTPASATRGQPSPGKLGFLFTGQGAQMLGMGRGLVARWPVFAETFDRVVSLFDGGQNLPLREVMWAEPGDPNAALLNRTDYTQPALFSLEMALFFLWRSWGVRPDVVAGHSIGEIAAACAAGLFSLEDAVRMVAARGRLMAALPEGGAMISIAAPEEEVAAAIASHTAELAIAAVNSPNQIVLSGRADVAQAVAEAFAARGVRTKALRVSHAFHSPAMDPMLADFRRVVASVRFQKPEIELVGNLGGQLDAEAMASPDYWVRHVREAVRFADGVAAMDAAGVQTFVELGPRATLLGLVPRCLPDATPVLHACGRRGRDEPRTILAALGGLWVGGQQLDWSAIFPPGVRRVALPTYAWQRSRYWAEVDRSQPTMGVPGTWPLSGLQVPAPSAIYHHVLRVGPQLQPYLRDHVIFGKVVVPGAFHLTTVLAVAAEHWPGQPIELGDIEFRRALTLEDNTAVALHVLLQRRGRGEGYEFQLATATDGQDWTIHVVGWVQPSDATPRATPSRHALAERATQPASVAAFLDDLRAHHIVWGPRWQWIAQARVGQGVAMAELAAPPEVGEVTGSAPLHPCLLDTSFGSTTFSSGAGEAEDSVPRLPFSVEKIRWWRAPTGKVRCGTIARPAAEGAETSVSDLILWDDTGVVAEVDQFVARRAPAAVFLQAPTGQPGHQFYHFGWRELPAIAPASQPGVGPWVVVGEATSERADALVQQLSGAIRATPTSLPQALEHWDAPVGVVCVWEPEPRRPAPEDALRLATEALAVVHTLCASKHAPTATIWLTHSAVGPQSDTTHTPAGSVVWGLGRTAVLEHPEIGLSLVDVGPKVSAEAVLDELRPGRVHTQVALRGDMRLAASWQRDGSATQAAPSLDRGTVLITGAFGALGQHVTRWMAAQGATHLLLAGRRGGHTPGAAQLVEQLAKLGAQASVVAVDVADRGALGQVLAAIPEERPLRAVVHAAGRLDDGMLRDLSGERFASVFAAKVQGAWNLHELTRDRELDLFVLFSSAAAQLGSAGQANYTAANAFLDGLARYRHALGLPAQSLAWGPWADGGMAAELSQAHNERISRLGLRVFEPEVALSLFAQALARETVALTIVDLDPKVVSRNQGSAVWQQVLGAQEDKPEATTTSWFAQLANLSGEPRHRALLAGVQQEVARILGVREPSTLRVDKPLMELGLDSLMAVELRNALGQLMGCTLPATLAFDYPTVDALAGRLATEIGEPREPIAELPAARDLPVDADQAIAIVGIGCRFPGGANDPEGLWHLLCDGVDAIQEVPGERWAIDDFYDPDPNARGKMTTRWGGFLADIDRFDPEFFGISPREAPSLDPQQRLLLETSWEALERAGKTPEQLMNSDTGVYVGICGNDYQGLATADIDAIDAYSLLGTSHSASVGRLSYWLGLKGPNIPVDTACSSSLVAVHLAVEALRRGTCSMALAGGVNLVLAPEVTVYFSRLRAMSPTGRCHAFSQQADGYVRSEGCGVVVLKRLADAQRDGDEIVAVIRGCAVNQDGRSSGLTAPNGPSQEAVIQRALADAGVAPTQVGYLEAHGTGTPLGDPIEVQAAAAALGNGRKQPLVVGSVKSNIGHTEGAAGIAGLIKAALCVQRGIIPKSLHCAELNQHIDWSALPVEVATETQPFPNPEGGRRIAGVSSFGFSGTNAHIVLSEPPPAPQPSEVRELPAHLFVVSARSEAAVHQQAQRIGQLVEREPELALSDLAYSLATQRGAMDERLAIVASSREDLRDALRDPGEGMSRGRAESSTRAFVLVGQGAQTPGMGRALHAAWPVFAEAFDRAAELFDGELPRPLKDVMWSEPGGDEAKLLDRTDFTQPALFVFEYALCTLWISWGIAPDVLLGHSIGEFAVACVAEVFSLEDAVRLVAARGRLMQSLPAGGAMAAVAVSEAQARSAIAHYPTQLAVAAVNGPQQVVLSGAAQPLAEVVATLAARGVRTKTLRVSHAFHSPLMAPMLSEFGQVAESVTYQRPRVQVVSTLLGRVCDDEMATADYWVRHIQGTVRFADAIQATHALGVRGFLEIGAKATLVSLIADSVADVAVIASVRSADREVEGLLTALGNLFCAGARVDWGRFFAGQGRRVALPTYPWQRERYWLDEGAKKRLGRAVHVGHPLLGQARSPANRPDLRIWQTELDLERVRWLADHCVRGDVVFPGAGYLEMALAVGYEAFPGDTPTIREVEFVESLSLEPGKPVEVQVVTTAEVTGALKFVISSRTIEADQVWITHARGAIVPTPGRDMPGVQLDDLRTRVQERIDAEETYAIMARGGLDYGPAFRGMLESHRGAGEVLGRVLLPEDAGDGAAYWLHPALLDACFHVMTGAFPEDARVGHTWLPIGVGSIACFKRPAGEVVCHVHGAKERIEGGALRRRVQLAIYDLDGTPVAHLHDFLVQSLTGAGLDERWFLEPVWEPVKAPAPKVHEGRFVVMGGPSMGETLASALQEAGHRVARFPAQAGATAGDYRALLDEAFAGVPATAVVHLESLLGPEGSGSTGLWEALTDNLDTTLHLAQALATADPGATRLYIVTRGAQATKGLDIALEQAPLLGFARTIQAEHPELRCTSLDLDPSAGVERSVAALAQELFADDLEGEVRWRGGRREVARIIHTKPDDGPAEVVQPAAGQPFRLETDAPGELDKLVLRTFERRPPGPGEVEIAVDAASLNFIDVMKAMGIYPGLGDGPIALGGECSGRITALGTGVDGLVVGQAVVAMAPHSLSSHVVAPVHAVAARPERLSAAQGAAIPAVYMTAWYALSHLAHLRRGERVLIHSATGGTGMAAIQIARHLGAEIFATAGTEEKRAWLRAHGIAHAMDSRALDFTREILDATDGEGVDVVLNSLSGAAIEASFDALAADGRFIEIGKTDIYSARGLSLAYFKKRLSFSAVDLAGLTVERPKRFAKLMSEVLDLFASGAFEPPMIECFPIDRADSGFRKMAQAKHKGKLVFTVDGTHELVRKRPPTRLVIRDDRSYLITGGLGGLGLQAAHWLGENGAGNVVLMGRSGVVRDEQREAVERIEALGAQVTIARGDVSSSEDVARVIDSIHHQGMPLAGVIHAAGVIDDGLLLQQNPQRLHAVLAPKVQGSLYLHHHISSLSIDFFVMYGSVAGLFGSAGQSGYAAANTFLDALAHHRRERGKVALSVDWGAFSDVGMAAESSARGARLAARGLGSLTPEEGTQALEWLIERDIGHAAVLPLDPATWAQADPTAAATPRLSPLFSGANAQEGESKNLLATLAASGPDQQRRILEDFLCRVASSVLRIPVERVDPAVSLTNLGLDSLMGLEFKQRLKRESSVNVPVSQLLDGSIASLIDIFVEALPKSSQVPEEAIAEEEDESWVDIEF